MLLLPSSKESVVQGVGEDCVRCGQKLGSVYILGTFAVLFLGCVKFALCCDLSFHILLRTVGKDCLSKTITRLS